MPERSAEAVARETVQTWETHAEWHKRVDSGTPDRASLERWAARIHEQREGLVACIATALTAHATQWKDVAILKHELAKVQAALDRLADVTVEEVARDAGVDPDAAAAVLALVRARVEGRDA